MAAVTMMWPNVIKVMRPDSSFIASIVNVLQPWQSLYADHTLVSTSVLFVHLASLVASAGLAFATDRAIVRTSPDDMEARLQRLHDLEGAHRPVLAALALSFTSGLLLLLADLEAFLKMPAFWVKMGLILLLMMNALLMMRRERQLQPVAPSLTGVSPQGEAVASVAIPKTGAANTAAANVAVWLRLRRHALASLVLWFAIVLAGTAMTSG